MTADGRHDEEGLFRRESSMRMVKLLDNFYIFMLSFETPLKETYTLLKAEVFQFDIANDDEDDSIKRFALFSHSSKSWM